MPLACRREWTQVGCTAGGESRQLSLVWGLSPESSEDCPHGEASTGAATGSSVCELGPETGELISLAVLLRAGEAGTACFCCGEPMQEVEQEDGGPIAHPQRQQDLVLKCRSCGAELARQSGHGQRGARS